MFDAHKADIAANEPGAVTPITRCRDLANAITDTLARYEAGESNEVMQGFFGDAPWTDEQRQQHVEQHVRKLVRIYLP